MKKKILLFLAVAKWTGLMAQPVVGMNQVGYWPQASKQAIVIGAANDDFFILSDNKRDTIFKGRLGSEKKSPVSSLSARPADFSAVNHPGKYWLAIAGREDLPVTIHANVYHPVSTAALRGFYYQRSDMALLPAYAGVWARPSGHPDTAVLVHASAAGKGRPEGAIISSPGGWYDAGDYNKYIVNSGVTMGTMLSAYEDFKDYYDTLSVSIPETGNGIPDLLDEILYNLRWMLTMQDPTDGGVYHKCTNAAFDGMVMPGVTKVPRYVVQKSTAATLDFAATMAQAARVFRLLQKQLPGLVDSCRIAAEKAWNWALTYPTVLYEQEEMNKQFKPAISTGAYGDKQLMDEWFWAAAELLITTGEKKYIEPVKKSIGAIRSLPGWPQVGMLGIFSLLRHAKKVEAYISLADGRKQLLLLADALIAGKDKSLSGTVMGASISDFIWGSNAVAANQGMLLLNAYLLTGEIKYKEGALSNLDYLLGKNATGFSFVTGIGYKSSLHPHHRPSDADKVAAPIPGLLVGGPNAHAYRQDKCEYPHKEAERQYTDALCSYASNEIAINWNAPLVYLAGALSAINK